jgi:hypothetical protein
MEIMTRNSEIAAYKFLHDLMVCAEAGFSLPKFEAVYLKSLAIRVKNMLGNKLKELGE